MASPPVSSTKWTPPTAPFAKLKQRTSPANPSQIVRVRLTHNIQLPVRDALITHSRNSGTVFQEILIGANQNGEFAITIVPAGRVWDLCATMDSFAP